MVRVNNTQHRNAITHKHETPNLLLEKILPCKLFRNGIAESRRFIHVGSAYRHTLCSGMLMSLDGSLC